MNSARTSLLFHLLSACALMAYTVVACTVTPTQEDKSKAPAEQLLHEEPKNAPSKLLTEQEMK